MASKTITFRFSEEVIEAIEARAKAIGSNRTAVMLEALELAYGFPSPATPPTTTEILQQKLHELGQQVTVLLEQLAESRQEIKQELAAVAEPNGRSFGRSLAVAQAQEPYPWANQLEQRARTLEQILAAAPDLVFVQDRTGRFTYVNPASARALGFDRSYLLGKTCQDLGFPEELQAPFSAQCEFVFTTGRSISGEISIPTIHEVRDYEYILSPIQGTDSRIDAVIFTARDITERKRTELALRESEEKYRNLFELANDSIFIIDISTHRILNANRNAARRLGYMRRELLQLTIADLQSSAAIAYYEEVIVPELRRRGSAVFEMMFRRKDGAEIPVEISSRVIEYGDRLVYQSFVRDITERKKIEAHLRLLESAVLNEDEADLEQ